MIDAPQIQYLAEEAMRARVQVMSPTETCCVHLPILIFSCEIYIETGVRGLEHEDVVQILHD